ncbi:MAG: hypothetical protein JO306_07705 [Gemmatimonadetes bacterium]|nr:hypothetical protein [Gemmatimonadota bacterium]
MDRLAAACEDLGIPYAIAGSVAAMAYGEPRLTEDVDMVLLLRVEDLQALLTRFPRPDFYYDEPAALEAIRSRGQFNIIDNETGVKADIFIAGDPLTSLQVTRARRLETFIGRAAMFSPPEELVVMKLKYYAFGGSEKHLRDIAAMLANSAAVIDQARIGALADEQGVGHVWQAVLRRIERK